MYKKISGHRYKNDKEIEVGIVTGKSKVEDVDDFYLRIGADEFHLRPDEMMLIIKILSDALLERVVGYEINSGRLGAKDYKLDQFHGKR